MLESLSHRQFTRVLVTLTENSGDKVVEGAAVKREGSRTLPFLVLLNSLQDQLFLKGGKKEPASLNAKALRC